MSPNFCRTYERGLLLAVLVKDQQLLVIIATRNFFPKDSRLIVCHDDPPFREGARLLYELS